jgi:hypothetical protein
MSRLGLGDASQRTNEQDRGPAPARAQPDESEPPPTYEEAAEAAAASPWIASGPGKPHRGDPWIYDVEARRRSRPGWRGRVWSGRWRRLSRGWPSWRARRRGSATTRRGYVESPPENPSHERISPGGWRRSPSRRPSAPASERRREAAADAPAATTAPPTRPLFTFGTGGRPTGGRTPAQRLGGGEPGAGRGAAPPASEAAVATPETVAAGRPHATYQRPSGRRPSGGRTGGCGNRRRCRGSRRRTRGSGRPRRPRGPRGTRRSPSGLARERQVVDPQGGRAAGLAGRGGPAGPQHCQPRPRPQHRPRRQRRHRGPCASEPSRRASRPSG